ncbi:MULTISPECIES: hypothetical protein [unclassified Acidiplasma]|uniref:hypothetical protein n=1 Tax=unclassified Acidiplasma TaxID=2641301 RepID=UPI0005E62B1A|nr:MULTISPECIES: hypothetical protein [unclassified Acidiplasma]KJE49168.1 hypothetical protein TZ01_03535 [Acidiplasma sp. MBA-1]WMT54888.1 MAG: hypothetical protein RE470_08225 [Acidiplasma sp.]
MEKIKKSLYFNMALLILMVYELVAAILTKWLLGIYLGAFIIIIYSFALIYYIYKIKKNNNKIN